MVSITNTPATTISDISCLVKIEITANVAPNEREPVSPIITFAGYVLYIKKPNKEPTRIKQNIPISELPATQVVPKLIIPKARNATADKLPANPSKPSVIFTALLLATKMNNINNP